MPRAHTVKGYPQTAATLQVQRSGCLSGFIIPPLAVIVISTLLASFALRSPAYSLAELPPQPSRISPIFTTEIQHWASSISGWTAVSGLDPNLVATVMQIESCGDPRAVSHSGAIGLFQVMPFHFTGVDNPYNPDTNAARGLAYLERSLEAAGGNARLALAGYNGGIGVISRAEWTWSDQTQRYVKYGWPIYQDARSGISFSAAVQEWLTRYGASLCSQAHKSLELP